MNNQSGYQSLFIQQRECKFGFSSNPTVCMALIFMALILAGHIVCALIPDIHGLHSASPSVPGPPTSLVNGLFFSMIFYSVWILHEVNTRELTDFR